MHKGWHMKYIKMYPKRFIILIIFSLLYILLNVYDKNNWTFTILFAILVFLSSYSVFHTNVQEEVLNKLIDEEVRRLGYSREQLYQVTGYNRFEVSENSLGQTQFWITPGKKKALLKKLKSIKN